MSNRAHTTCLNCGRCSSCQKQVSDTSANPVSSCDHCSPFAVHPYAFQVFLAGHLTQAQKDDVEAKLRELLDLYDIKGHYTCHLP